MNPELTNSFQDSFPKKVEAFASSDGKLFTSEEEAADRQRLVDFCSWYERNSLFSDDSKEFRIVDKATLFDWLEDNFEELQTLIK